MKFHISKRIVKAGDIIEVTWHAEHMTSPRLVMHTGMRESTLAVPDQGSKKFRLKGAQGAHWIGYKAWDGNKEVYKKYRIFVYGRQPQTDQFEYIDRGSTPWTRFQDKAMRYWNQFSSEKKRLYYILLALIAYQALFSFHLFTIAQLLLLALTFYLFWQIIKR